MGRIMIQSLNLISQNDILKFLINNYHYEFCILRFELS